MRIEEYTLDFTPVLQREFVRQNEAILCKQIKAAYAMTKDHMEAIQEVVDRIYDDCRISICVSLLRPLDVFGDDE